MAEKWHVRPIGPQPALVHPIDGPLAQGRSAKGVWSMWTADQFTFQLIRDGAIERVPDEPAKPSPTPKPEAARPSASAQKN